MYSKIVALIPARGGSKRIPRKNLKILNGYPLVSYPIRAAQGCSLIDEVWVSTEDSQIAVVAKWHGAKILNRPKELAENDTPTEAVMEHFIANTSCDILVLLEATHPLIFPDDLTQALRHFINNKFDSLIGLSRKHMFLWMVDGDTAKPLNYNPNNRPRMQEFEGSLVEDAGFWITTVQAFQQSRCRISGKIGYYILPHEAIDIDEPLDFKLAEVMVKEYAHKLFN